MAAVMGIITLILCVGLGIFVKFKATQTVTGEFKNKVHNLNSMISEILLDDIVAKNKFALTDKIIQISRIHKDLIAVKIRDANGGLLIDWRNSPQNDGKTLHTEQAVSVSGNLIGNIDSYWSMAQTNGEITRRWKTVVLIVFGFFFILAIQLLLTMKFTLFNPLHKIEKRLSSFRDRNIDSFIPRSHWTSVEFNNIEAVADLLEQEIIARLVAENNLKLARNQANKANSAKSLFLANMSHELRTPLNAILGYSELLQELAQEKGELDFVDDLQKIHKSGTHLLQLLNGVLDLSKIEAGKITLSNSFADTCDIAMELVDTVQPLVTASNNSIACNFDINVKPFTLDTLRFRQILFNLLSNAAKFTKNGLIELSIKQGINEDAGYILYRVRDTGIGIAADKLEQIFEDFVQGSENTSHHYGGTGLGLAISKKLSHLMGGDIMVSSEIGKGSTFTLKLPRRAGEMRQQKSA